MIEAENTPPIPHYPTRRLIGLEIELDANKVPFHDPGTVDGWQSKPDGSLRNGKEYVLEPPLPLVEAKMAVDAFCAAAIKAKMHVSMTGGYHIHVQIHDYSLGDATHLAQLYYKYQGWIDALCGPSRRTSPHPNQYCTPYERMPQVSELRSLFSLDIPARDRVEAKRTRQRMVLNFAMMRCSNPLERTVEFRQPSPSKKAVNIYGWACFAAALTEVARDAALVKMYVAAKPTWRNFLALCRRIEKNTGATQLVDWVVWRRDYLQNVPSSHKVQKLYYCLVGKAHGLFFIARKLDINLAVAAKLVRSETAKRRLVEESPGRWRVTHESIAAMDLNEILKLWQAAESPAVTASVPQAQDQARVA